jgi:hypothetical protein
MGGKNKDLRHNDAGARTSRCDFIAFVSGFIAATGMASRREQPVMDNDV